MIVNGKPGLFRLNALNNGWVDYYVDAQYNVFSTKTSSTPRQMTGSVVRGGRVYTLSDLRGQTTTITTDQLRSRLALQSTFQRETAIATATTTQTLQAVGTRAQAVGFAADLQDQIAGRGFIIGRIDGDAIVFGSKPRVHTTLDSVKTEIARLATAKAGTQYIWLQIQGSLKASALVWG